MSLKTSLIIPAFNEEKNIEACLMQAIKNSKSKFHEIIVIDNASTDRTGEIAGAVQGVRVVHEQHKGITRARQRGYLEATGDILAFVDADTRMQSGWIEQIELHFKRREIVCLSGPYKYFDLAQWQQSVVWLYWHILGYPTYLATGYMAVGGNFAIRKDTLDKMNGFDTSIEFYGEDTNTARRASKFGKVIFSLSFIMPTSGRRLAKEGFLKIGYIYISNFISEVVFKKPSHSKYSDIR